MSYARVRACVCRVVGRPARIKALERFLDYVKSKPRVWVTTRAKIAEHFHKYHHPTKPAPAAPTDGTSSSIGRWTAVAAAAAFAAFAYFVRCPKGKK